MDLGARLWCHGAEEITMRITLRVLVVSATLATVGAPVCVHDADPNGGYRLRRGWRVSPPPGIVREPSLLTKFAMSTDTGLGGAPRDGWYVQSGNLITGGGWISGGPGYRRTIFDGRARIDAAAALSWNLYKSLRASFE